MHGNHRSIFSMGLAALLLILPTSSNAQQHPELPNIVPAQVPELIITDIADGVNVMWQNLLMPSLSVETRVHEIPDGNIVFEIKREDGEEPDTLTVLDFPDGYVVLGPQSITLEENTSVTFKIIKYSGV